MKAHFASSETTQGSQPRDGATVDATRTLEPLTGRLFKVGRPALFMLAVLALQLVAAAPGSARAKASASSTAMVYTADDDDDWGRWAWTSSATKATMFWTSGPYSAGKTTCGAKSPNEKKFLSPGGPLLSRTFVGFGNPVGAATFQCKDGAGNFATGRGWGASRIVTGTWVYWTYRAEWNVETGGGGAYSGEVIGNDPWPMTAADFGPLSDPYMDIFIPIGMQSGSFGNESGNTSYVGFDVAYQTAAGTSELLQISIGNNGTTINTGSIDSSNVELYSMTYDPLYGPSAPSTLPSQRLTASDLAQLLQQDLVREGPTTSMQQPIWAGVVVRHVPVPTQEMLDGAVLDVYVSSSAHDSTETPGVSQ